MVAKVHWDRWLPRLLGVGTAVAVAAIGFVFVFLLYWPFPTLNIHSIHVNDIPASSNIITYQVDYCKYTSLPATITLELVGVGNNQTNEALQSFKTAAPPGCGKANINVKLVTAVSPGLYNLYETVTYQINPLRTVVVHAESNTFRVTP